MMDDLDIIKLYKQSKKLIIFFLVITEKQMARYDAMGVLFQQ